MTIEHIKLFICGDEESIKDTMRWQFASFSHHMACHHTQSWALEFKPTGKAVGINDQNSGIAYVHKEKKIKGGINLKGMRHCG